MSAAQQSLAEVAEGLRRYRQSIRSSVVVFLEQANWPGSFEVRKRIADAVENLAVEALFDTEAGPFIAAIRDEASLDEAIAAAQENAADLAAYHGRIL